MNDSNRRALGIAAGAGDIFSGVEAVGKAVGDSLGILFPDLGENIGDQFGGLPNDYTLGQSTYDFTQRVFPSDLGSNASFNGHYMVININVQNNSAMSKISRSGPVGGVSGTGTSTIFNRLDEISKTDALRYRIDGLLTNDSNLPLNQGGLSSRTRFTRRIKESIALYMPNSELSFTDAHDYENISLTRFVTGGVGGAAGALLTGAGAAFPGAKSAIDAAGSIGNAIGSGVAGAAQVLGAPINPKVEILFANTFQRQFAFDFLLAPSTPEESMAIKQIIRTLRFHAAPELRPSEIGSFFWIPPSEFDITFYNRGAENTAIPRINTCVLNQIDVSYAPTGAYATFSNGHPVQIRLMLRFTETEVAHKLRVLQGF